VGASNERCYCQPLRNDELDLVVSDTLNPRKARILLMPALTRTNNTTDFQRIHAY